MEDSGSPLSSEIISERLFQLFLNKGYPSSALQKDVTVNFSYNSQSNHLLKFPLIVKTDIPLLIAYYDPSRGGLSSSMRPLLAMARILFTPHPLYALLTNLSEFILIDVSTGKTERGDESVIPRFTDLTLREKKTDSKFNYDIERKILKLYLSCG